MLLPAGSIVNLQDIDNKGWARVQTSDGSETWIHLAKIDSITIFLLKCTSYFPNIMYLCVGNETLFNSINCSFSMDSLYLVVLGFLLILAIFDLSVGVANDAVNFLAPAAGARAAKFKVILAVAAVGIFIGASTSSGMMDIARHGILQPQHYSFADVMCVFLAVSATDVILLDIFNTLGLPTSTTVSLVFGLLGGSTALALKYIINDFVFGTYQH